MYGDILRLQRLHCQQHRNLVQEEVWLFFFTAPIKSTEGLRVMRRSPSPVTAPPAVARLQHVIFDACSCMLWSLRAGEMRHPWVTFGGIISPCTSCPDGISQLLHAAHAAPLVCSTAIVFFFTLTFLFFLRRKKCGRACAEVNNVSWAVSQCL